jgi:hypothetical protein
MINAKSEGRPRSGQDEDHDKSQRWSLKPRGSTILSQGVQDMASTIGHG